MPATSGLADLEAGNRRYPQRALPDQALTDRSVAAGLPRFREMPCQEQKTRPRGPVPQLLAVTALESLVEDVIARLTHI